MVVAEWFIRFGQLLAPDENYVADENDPENRSLFWDTVAPDPNFANASDAAAAAAAAADGLSNGSTGVATPRAQPNSNQGMEETTPPTPHHHQQQQQQQQPHDPARFSTPAQQPAASPPFFTPCATCQTKLCSSCQKLATPDSAFQTPSQHAIDFAGLLSPRSKGRRTASKDVTDSVLEAAHGVAMAQCGAGANSDIEKEKGVVIRKCSNAGKLSDKSLRGLEKSIKKYPDFLKARASNNAMPCPDGYTPFQATAHSNNLGAAQRIWKCVTEEGWTGITPAQLLEQTNMQGRTALHISAAQGSVETLEFIKGLHQQVFGVESPAPKDLMGHTPLAVAFISPAARRNKRAMLPHLFSPEDPSILGEQLPPEERTISARDLQFEAGTAEVPGQRIFMEDYTVAKILPSKGVLLAVCDGHSDKGEVAKWVGENLVQSFSDNPDFPLQSAVDWETACRDICLECDKGVKAAGLKTGGAVGVWIIVTKSQIVCANVGDCRCILLQHPAKTDDVEIAALTEATANVSLQDSSNNNNNIINDAMEQKPSSRKDKESLQFSVTALSTDHKPNLLSEKLRIENAGLTVKEEPMNDPQDGSERIICKVELSAGDRMAPSRAWGDFEYKTNEGLPPDQQAVTAAPEVNVHSRTSRDAFLVAACDGIWDVMSNEDVAAFVAGRLEHYRCGNDPAPTALLPTIANDLLKECLNRGTTDNLSVTLAALSDWAATVSSLSTTHRKIDF